MYENRYAKNKHKNTEGHVKGNRGGQGGILLLILPSMIVWVYALVGVFVTFFALACGRINSGLSRHSTTNHWCYRWRSKGNIEK